MTGRIRGGAFGALMVVFTAGCAATTYDTSVTTTTAPSVTTTTLAPSGEASELLPEMLQEVRDLSRRVAEKDGAQAAAAYIEALWAAALPQVEATRPELVSDFEFVVRRCRSAADRNRPADADRAYNNLVSLVDAYLA
ncbi:MAG: hypothetical protein Q7V88_08715 [Actinomycetota bacterium]|nr:hypothetical protein [Actinomycetota bacterium]